MKLADRAESPAGLSRGTSTGIINCGCQNNFKNIGNEKNNQAANPQLNSYSGDLSESDNTEETKLILTDI